MNTIKVGVGQTIFDVVLQACGTLEGLGQVLAANDLSVSDAVAVGQVIIIPDGVTVDTGVLAVVGNDGIEFGTAGI